jgi:predicted MFS family arabinose efflux permease
VSGPAPRRHAALPALLWANVVAGAGTFMPAALLVPIANDLGASIAATGQALTVFAIAMAIGAPLLAAATAGVDRRTLLVSVLALFGLLTAGSALVASLAAMLAVRAAAGLVAGLITPQAATVAGLLVPPERRASAVAYVFNGYALSIVVGLSLGAWLGDAFGWRAALAGVAAMSLLGAAWVGASVPRGLTVPPLGLAAAGAFARDGRLRAILAVTVLQATGQFLIYSYLGPLLERQAGIEPRHAGLAFAALAATGLVGGLLAMRRLAVDPPGRVASAGLAAMAVGFASWPAIEWSGGAPWALAWVALAWGTPCFAVNMAQQARLVQARPALASLSVALNSSGMFVGQAAGTAAAGALIHGGAAAALAPVGAALIVLALAVSLRIDRAAAHARAAG